MTMPDERYRAVLQTQKFLEELLVTPRIPKIIKDRARACLRHYPGTWEMQMAAKGAPTHFQEHMEPLWRMVLKYEQDTEIK